MRTQIPNYLFLRSLHSPLYLHAVALSRLALSACMPMERILLREARAFKASSFQRATEFASNQGQRHTCQVPRRSLDQATAALRRIQSPVMSVNMPSVCRRLLHTAAAVMRASLHEAGSGQGWASLRKLRSDVATLLMPQMDALPDVQTRGGLYAIFCQLLEHIDLVPGLLAAGVMPVRALSLPRMLRLQLPYCAARLHL